MQQQLKMSSGGDATGERGRGAFQTCGMPVAWLWRESKKVLTATWTMGKQDLVLGREGRVLERKVFFCE